MSSSIRFKKFSIRSIGIIIFLLILSKINVSKTIDLLLDIDINYFLVSVLLIFPMIGLRAWRWQLLMKCQNINYTLKDSFLIYMVGLYMGVITPGRLGDFIKVLYLRKDRYSWGQSILSVLSDRLFDLISLFLLGYAGLFIFSTLFEHGFRVITFYIICTILLVIVFLSKKTIISKFIQILFKKLIPASYKNDVGETARDFYKNLKLIDINVLLFSSVATLLAWFVYYTQIYLVTLSLAIPVSFWYLATCITISAMLTLLPISISGIGTRDATLIIMFSYVGVDSESAIALSFMILIMYIINAFFGLLAWFKIPLTPNKELN